MADSAYKTALGLLLKSMMTDYDGNRRANHQIVIPIGPTPQVLLDIGMPDLQLAITGKVIDKVYFDHGIQRGTLERISSLLEKPKAIYMGQINNPGSAVVTYEVRDSHPIIVAVHPNKQLGGRSNFYNNVASMYVKKSNTGETIEARWKREGLLLWEATQPVGPAVVPIELKVVVGK